MTVAIVLTNYDRALDVVQNDIENRIYELRLDCDPKLLTLIESNLILPENVILTVRSKMEGGKITIPNDRKKLIIQALSMKVGYLDLELKTDFETIEQIINGSIETYFDKLIISQHKYSEGLLEGYNKFYTTFSNLNINNPTLKNNLILKYVGLPADSYETLELIKKMSQHPKQILLGIGISGDITRTLHSSIGQELVYGGLENNDIIQYNILDELKQTESLMLGLVGCNLSHSLSPRIHNILLQSNRTIGYYHLLEVSNQDRANNLISELSNFDFNGFNITIPYKKSVIDILDYVDSVAENLQAVNTINISNGKFYGYNTDITGFSRFLRNNNLHKLEDAIVLGAGGASRAICQSLIQEGISVSVITRSINRFDEFPKNLKSQINLILRSEIPKQMKSEIFINTTPLGLKGEDPRDFVDLPTNVQAVVDLLYHKNDTLFVQKIKNLGIEAYDGKEMLFNQAVDSFKIWTNKTINHKDLYLQFLKEIR